MTDKSGRLPVPQYSYRQESKKEERRVYRRIALILTVVFVVLTIIWFTGTSFIDALSVLSNGNSSKTNNNTPVELPLLAPKLETLPEAINQESITIEGETTSEVDVLLTVNSKEVAKVKASTTGAFKFEKVRLKEGLNLIKITATDKHNETEETSATITFDRSKPPLALTAPADGTIFNEQTKTVIVSGTTETNAVVQVNGLQAVVETSGKFSYNLPVMAGDNQIEVVATDLAGNLTTVKIDIVVSGDASAEP